MTEYQIKKLLSFVQMQANCPCCEGIEECLDDCTFKEDCEGNGTMDHYERMSAAREALAIPVNEHEPDKDPEREQFEKWISEPPYERSVERFPMDESKHARPGQYQDNSVQIAWEAWRESRIRLRE